jgi:putative FmdB family regulatory protein
MPTYEFRCPHGHEFEKFYRTISGAEAQALCPQCGEPAERFMSATGFAFKGSGFYLTDYGKNAHRDKGTPNGKGAAPSAEGAKSESGGSEGPKAEAGSGAGGGDAGKAGEAKTPTPAADSKPPAAPPKKSSDE